MAINERIAELRDIKNRFKQGFSELGVDLTDVAFKDYPSKLTNIKPKLKTPILYRENTYMVVPEINNGYVDSVEVYCNDEYKFTLEQERYNLLDFGAGELKIKVIAIGENFKPSDQSEVLEYTIYRVEKQLLGISCDSLDVAGIHQTIVCNLIAQSGYLPRSVEINMQGEQVEYVYDCYTGELIISNVTGDLQIIASSNEFPILPTPMVDVYENIISWNNVENASGYNVYSNGEFLCSIQENSLDLSNFLPIGQNYNVRVSAYGQNYQESALSQEVIVSVRNSYPVYGVRGLNASSVVLERTDDAIGLDLYFNESSGEIVSDFDTLFPYSEMQVYEIDGNKMVKVPEMYFRVGTNANNVLTDIAVSKQPKEDGKWFKSEEFYFGCYHCCVFGDKFSSKSGVNKVTSGYSTANYEQMVATLGENYKTYSIQNYCALLFLYFIESAHKNGNRFVSSVTNATLTGSTDSVVSPSGVGAENGNFKYRNIEDFSGTFYEVLTGLMCNSGAMRCKINGTKYENMGVTITAVERYITGYAWLDNFPFVIFPIEFSTYTTSSFMAYGQHVTWGNNYYRVGGNAKDVGRAVQAMFAIVDHTNSGHAYRLVYKEKV